MAPLLQIFIGIIGEYWSQYANELLVKSGSRLYNGVEETKNVPFHSNEWNRDVFYLLGGWGNEF